MESDRMSVLAWIGAAVLLAWTVDGLRHIYETMILWGWL